MLHSRRVRKPNNIELASNRRKSATVGFLPSWLTINGGGPTDDKPEVVASPPRDSNVLRVFLNLRVTDIGGYYDLSTITAGPRDLYP
jgi:hypothetical protein